MFGRIFRRNPWRDASKEPAPRKDKPTYSYDLILSDGQREYIGYYTFQGKSYKAYGEVILFPVEKWRYATKQEMQTIKTHADITH